MIRKKMILNDIEEIRMLVFTNRRENNSTDINTFFELHKKFRELKALEGLSPRTLSDHRKHMEMFKRYLLKVKWFQLGVTWTHLYGNYWRQSTNYYCDRTHITATGKWFFGITIGGIVAGASWYDKWIVL